MGDDKTCSENIKNLTIKTLEETFWQEFLNTPRLVIAEVALLPVPAAGGNSRTIVLSSLRQASTLPNISTNSLTQTNVFYNLAGEASSQRSSRGRDGEAFSLDVAVTEAKDRNHLDLSICTR